MTTGVGVGGGVPPAGFAVIPSRSPGTTPSASLGGVAPAWVTASRPADRAAPEELMTQSSYTLVPASAGRSAVVTTASPRPSDTTTVTVPPGAAGADSRRASGAASTAAIAL